jgi:hypothetical protein
MQRTHSTYAERIVVRWRMRRPDESVCAPGAALWATARLSMLFGVNVLGVRVQGLGFVSEGLEFGGFRIKARG